MFHQIPDDCLPPLFDCLSTLVIKRMYTTYTPSALFAHKDHLVPLETDFFRSQSGERVTFQGFGTFEKTSRAARNGVNPQTGAAIQIPATEAPKFKAGTAFKMLVKGK